MCLQPDDARDGARYSIVHPRPDRMLIDQRLTALRGELT
jgi:hypothetical protein